MSQFANLAAVDAAASDLFDVRLFTVLGIADDSVTRLYSSEPDAYPVGGTKSLVRDISPEWTRVCIESKQVFLGLTPQEMQRIFADHELIARLGCGAIANVPVLDEEQVIGTLCILTPEGGLTEADAEAASLGARSVEALRAALHTDGLQPQGGPRTREGSTKEES